MLDAPLARRARSVCPHDCPSVCALDVEILGPDRIGRVHGHRDHPYTQGVVCAKVARYAERLHHPDRLTTPLLRTGPKGAGQFRPIGWAEALDRAAEGLLAAERAHGPEAVWPYYYAGTMGLVQRDGINRLRHVKRWSRQHTTICTAIVDAGWAAGVGAKLGPDSREMAEADLIIVWGCDPVATQVNVMTHVQRARKGRGAELVVVDCWRTPTAEAADRALILRPGTDAALACAMMHCAFRDGWADREYLARYADTDYATLAAHFAPRTPDWAAAITGLSVAEIEDLAARYGRTDRAFIRLGYGFARSRNGAAQVHAVSCLATIGGKWRHRGGGTLWGLSGIYGLDKTMIEGLDARDLSVRRLDMSRLASVLAGDADALAHGPPVAAMLTQNTNPAQVAPDSVRVRRGLAREDLFLVVHEQMPTETAAFADIVLPATMFLEHDDIYVASAHATIQIGRKLVEPPPLCRSNHWVLAELAKRVGAEHPGFAMTELELIEATLAASGRPSVAAIEAAMWLDETPSFAVGHFVDGFPQPDGRFRFRPDWAALGPDGARLPTLPDQASELLEQADAAHPFRLVTAPARGFLNSTFTETPGSRAREGRPTAKLHPDDLAALGLADGAMATLGNARGRITLAVEAFDGVPRGVTVVTSIWPAAAFPEGVGVNALIGDDPAPPNGGAAFHDCAVWIRPAA